ncbi:hypothetical protein QZH41_008531 [Actinostola sp. cb2023]|nr:hypothetical protein QZH41_008531 [Actinostola sp. cb2023]
MSVPLKANISRGNPDKVFELIEKIGGGTYGDVFKARVIATGDLAAVKVVKVEPGDDFALIQQEIAMMEQCQHENIINYIGSYMRSRSCQAMYLYMIRRMITYFGNSVFRREKLWIGMEFCGGGSLQDIYCVTGPCSEPQIAFVITETLKGLAYLHDKRLMHRDIKGANILLTTSGDIKLADFGISARITETMKKRNSFIGTPYWMAPEMAAVERTGGYDLKCDIWAAGITVIECAELQPPMFDLHPMRALYVIGKKNFIPPTLKDKEKWSAEMHHFIKASLIKNPKKRPGADKMLTHPFCCRHLTKAVTQDLLDKYSAKVNEKSFANDDSDDEDMVDENVDQKVDDNDTMVVAKDSGTFKATSKQDDEEDQPPPLPPKEGKEHYQVPRPPSVKPPPPPKPEHLKISRSTSDPPRIPPPAVPPPRPPTTKPPQGSVSNGIPSPLPRSKHVVTTCFSKIFNECPVHIHCTATWINPATRNKHILIGAAEGIYSLNITDQVHDIEMEQISSKKCTWLAVIENIMVSITGTPPCISMHNLVSLHDKHHPMFFNTMTRGVGVMQRIQESRGCTKCCIVNNPYNNQLYLCAALPNNILLMQWYEPLDKFMKVNMYEVNLPSPLPLFETLIMPEMDYPLIVVGVRENADRTLNFDYANLNSTSNWFTEHREGKKLVVDHFDQLEKETILICADNTIRFVNLEGKPKQTKRGVAEIRFEIKPDSVVCLQGSVLGFHRHGLQGRSLLTGQVSVEMNDQKRLFRLLGADSIAVVESRSTHDPDGPCNLYILASAPKQR